MEFQESTIKGECLSLPVTVEMGENLGIGQETLIPTNAYCRRNTNPRLNGKGLGFAGSEEGERENEAWASQSDFKGKAGTRWCQGKDNSLRVPA